MIGPNLTSRFLSVALLLMSAAPLASLYAVFVSMTSDGSCSLLHGGASTAAHEASLATVLQNPNSTLADLLTVLFRPDRSSSPSSLVDTFFLAHREHLLLTPQYHWTIVVPWMISLFFGLILPACLSLLSLLQYEGEDGDDAQGWLSFQQGEKRRVRLLQTVKQHQKTLELEDMVSDDDTAAANHDDDEPYPRWKLPQPGETVDSAPRDKWRQVPGMCIICYNPYTCGDNIVWSSNPKCSHAFCEECIVAWLMRQKQRRRRKKQCPCCRRAFLAKAE